MLHFINYLNDGFFPLAANRAEKVDRNLIKSLTVSWRIVKSNFKWDIIFVELS